MTLGFSHFQKASKDLERHSLSLSFLSSTFVLQTPLKNQAVARLVLPWSETGPLHSWI